MELDKRIETLTDIQSVTNGCHDWEFMTKKGYFANRIFDFKDLKKCAYGEYADWREHDNCFLCEDAFDKTFSGEWYAYFIPEDALKSEEPEEKYRPYKNAQELFEDIGVYIGDVIHFRRKDSKAEYHALITSHLIYTENGTTKICLGSTIYYTMQELFDLFELRSRDDWLPFGIEEQV